ncbi:hypothetical protein C4556_03830 [Candidatus Parcubacteria bacterium]|nr:MAG: hypothetical protein C4556_03830 [Candidatus Parcubacteria bacterium]
MNSSGAHRLFFGLFALAVVTPTPAEALTFVSVAELFNIFIGLMLTAALLLFFGGLWVYFSRLGTWPNNRDEAIKIMEWGVAVLFTLIILLAIVQFFQRYPKVMSMVVAGIVILILAGITLWVTMAKKKKEEH